MVRMECFAQWTIRGNHVQKLRERLEPYGLEKRLLRNVLVKRGVAVAYAVDDASLLPLRPDHSFSNGLHAHQTHIELYAVSSVAAEPCRLAIVHLCREIGFDERPYALPESPGVLASRKNNL